MILKKNRRSLLWIGILAVVLLLGGWVGHLTWHAIHLRQIVIQISQERGKIPLPQAAADLHGAASDLVAIRADLRPLFPLLSGLAAVPRVGPYLGQVEPWLEFAANLALGAEKVLAPFEPALGNEQGAAKAFSAVEALSAGIVQGQNVFSEAKGFFAAASAARGRINAELLPLKYRKWYASLDQYYPLVDAVVELLPTLPGMLGAQEPASYLIVAQNRDELRATGGFISGIGTLRIARGKIAEFSLGDSYRIDDFSKGYPKPPEPIQRFMLAGYWVPRDANWSPDFPTAAKKIQELYTLSTGAQTQGVIVFDQKAVQQLLDVTGPVSLPGNPEPVTSANVESFMHDAWSPGSKAGTQNQAWWEHRKDFMHQLGSAMLDRLTAARRPGDLANLLKTTLDLIQKGHLLFHFDDPGIQNVIERLRLGGQIQPGSGDFLMLVDSNIGFNKVDPLVHRKVYYQVDLGDPNHPKAEAVFSYQHASQAAVPCKHVADYGEGTYADLQARCYWDYWRAYFPAGTQLLQSTVENVPADWLLTKKEWDGTLDTASGENQTQFFGGLMVLPPKTSRDTRLQVALPASVVQPLAEGKLRYTLVVQKQAGLDALPVQLEIKVPSEYPYLTSLTPGASLVKGSVKWTGEVDGAKTFDFVFSTAPGE